ncbi:MAG: hypothetical protein P0120_22105 [Nitrospira sp.]|nr:hypothetical protein [Nitrospira sp.]
MKLPCFMIGHSTRSIEEFVELLRGADIALVGDIRTAPRSMARPNRLTAIRKI